MKREFTLDIDGQQITVSAERDGDVIRVSRDGASYSVTILADSAPGLQTGAQVPTGGVGPRATGGLSSSRSGASTSAAPVGGGSSASGRPDPPTAGGPGAVTSPMTGVIDQVLVNPGDSVAEGARLVVLEAMKMYIDVMAPTAGTVASVAVAAGESVKEGQQLLAVTPHGAG